MFAIPLRHTAAALLCFLTPLVHGADPSTTTDVDLDTWRINTGALTTAFKPDPTCLSERRTKYSRPGAWPQLEIGCEGPGGDECCPDGWAGNRYFSPGMCPSGYNACALPSTRQRDETTNLCCPSNYDCPTQVYWDICTSRLNTKILQEYTDEHGDLSTETWYAVSATAIQIRFRETDSGVVPIPTDSFRLPPPKTQEEIDAEEAAANNRELSTGAKAGIGVGVAVGVVAIVFAVVWFFRKKAKSRQGRAQAGFMMVDPSASSQADETEAPPPYSKR